MPFCPKCKYEYREGVERCPDCDLQLKDHLPEEKQTEHPEEEWVSLGSFSDDPERQIVKGILEEAGIPVWMKIGLPSSVWPGTIMVDPLAESVIMVPAPRLEEAKAMLQQALEE